MRRKQQQLAVQSTALYYYIDNATVFQLDTGITLRRLDSEVARDGKEKRDIKRDIKLDSDNNTHRYNFM
jgi:hypothetical protein